MTDDTIRTTTDTFEQSLRDLIGLGRLWAAHGLTIGSQALDASAKSLEVTSRFLNELKGQLGESTPAAPEAAPEA